ncbi:Potassium channel toxin alpha-KTx 16.2 [Bienertia sinuspersici]
MAGSRQASGFLIVSDGVRVVSLFDRRKKYVVVEGGVASVAEEEEHKMQQFIPCLQDMAELATHLSIRLSEGKSLQLVVSDNLCTPSLLLGDASVFPSHDSWQPTAFSKLKGSSQEGRCTIDRFVEPSVVL